MSNYPTAQWTKGFAVFFGISFIGCFLWDSIITDPVLKELHMNMLKISFFGFSGRDLTSFVSGIVQSTIWGAVAGWLIATCLNMFKKK